MHVRRVGAPKVSEYCLILRNFHRVRIAHNSRQADALKSSKSGLSDRHDVDYMRRRFVESGPEARLLVRLIDGPSEASTTKL